jgi:ubiquinone/menaquinone biosynthesis C-methylase UbiE
MFEAMSVDHPTASDYFGSMVESYDSLMHRCVPRYEEMTKRLMEYLPANASRILELGCGTGNLSLRLARRFPNAQLTVVDAAPEMIEVTRARLNAVHPSQIDRTHFITSRFEDLAPAAHSFDLVTSCISLHHVADKGSLYRALYQAISPGGTFRFADQLRGGTPANHDLNWSRWLKFCRQPRHCIEDEIQSLLEHATAHDHYTPLLEHLGLLGAAGFVQLDCVWRNWLWGIVTAERPAT